MGSMNIYNGVYSWDGKRHGQREPIAWFPGAYRLQIFDLAQQQKRVSLLKPYLCIFSETGSGHCISAQPEKFVRQICEDFSLEIERVLWVEDIAAQPQRYEVVVFSQTSTMGNVVFYHVSRRPPTDAELRLIEQQLVQLSH